jgi:glycosidase
MDDKAGSTSYHGYWPRDFKKTNPFFGEMIGFDILIETAHANDIKVIIDFSPNHTSPASINAPDYIENGTLFDNGDYIASYLDDLFGYFHHNGGTDYSSYEDVIYRNYSDSHLYDLADLNQQAPKIDQILKESIKLWLDKGIDGIRIDSVKHMSFGWLKSFMFEIYNHRPVFTFGEWFSGAETDPLSFHFANQSGMSLLDFHFAFKLRQVLSDNTADWFDFHRMIQSSNLSYDRVIDQVTFIDNHDMDRFMIDENNTRKILL